MRVVEVWLDPEHREYFYTREPTIRGYPVGDISEQLAFKEKHKCRSFKWFVENVAFEVLEKFPPPPPNVGWGEVREYLISCFSYSKIDNLFRTSTPWWKLHVFTTRTMK